MVSDLVRAPGPQENDLGKKLSRKVLIKPGDLQNYGLDLFSICAYIFSVKGTMHETHYFICFESMFTATNQ